MRPSPKLISDHRLARLIVCARAMIVWAAAVCFEGLFANRRRIRQRYRGLSIGKLTRLVRNLMIARAAQLLNRHLQLRRQWRNYAPSGFRRRRYICNILRSIGGSRLRRFLNEGDLAQRFARLIRVLSNLDHYVRSLLLRRCRRGINRLITLVIVRPPQEAVHVLTAASPALADSS